MIAWIHSTSRWLILVLMTAPLVGCVVGQAPGKGRMMHVREPASNAGYWLYLPEGYDPDASPGSRGPRRPLVVTFHGMKPFDNARSQAREWQQEADRYGFIVVAPECESADLLKEFPLRTVNPTVKLDEERVIAVLNDVQQRAEVDPRHVLATSWSSGGYLAHYMVNRHPHRFSCIAPRQSNFSAAVLDPNNVPKYRDHKVGIFYTENDFAVCQRESQDAARWYARHGFDVTFAVFKDLGHERRPSVAAAFFAGTCGAEARTPPTELARMQVTRVALPKLAASDASGTPRPTNAPGGPAMTSPPARPAPLPNNVNGSVYAARPAPSPTPRPAARPANPPPQTARSVSPPRATPPPLPPTDRSRSVAAEISPLRVRVSSTIGIAPLLVNFSALTPADLGKDAYFVWLADGQPIANSMTGQKYLTTPGRHQLECVMTTADGREFRASKTVTVLERISNSNATNVSTGSR